MRLTLEIVAKTLFDAEIGGDSAEASAAMETLMRAFIARTGSLITPPHWFPTPVESPRVERAIRRLERSSWRSSPSGARAARTGATCCRCSCTPRTRRAAGR